jgi:hypothetical protein
MIIVMAPHPIPKIIAPLIVAGDVTISVAMKSAPSINPPLKR